MAKTYAETYGDPLFLTNAECLLLCLEKNGHIGFEKGVWQDVWQRETYLAFPERFGHLDPNKLHGPLYRPIQHLRDGDKKDPLGRLRHEYGVRVHPDKSETEEFVYYLDPPKE